MKEQKYFPKKFILQTPIINKLALILVEAQHLYKHERKALLENHLIESIKKEQAIDREGWKISIFDWEKLSREAEKVVLRDAKMTLKEAQAGVVRRNLKIACDPLAQNRDKIMADRLIVDVAGLDAKLSGGFEDDIGDALVEALEEIDKDKEQDG